MVKTCGDGTRTGGWRGRAGRAAAGERVYAPLNPRYELEWQSQQKGKGGGGGGGCARHAQGGGAGHGDWDPIETAVRRAAAAAQGERRLLGGGATRAGGDRSGSLEGGRGRRRRRGFPPMHPPLPVLAAMQRRAGDLTTAVGCGGPAAASPRGREGRLGKG